jgi:hypothetical protein
MKDDFKFYFPSKVLQNEDFSPVESSLLKDYYRNSFLKIIDKVRKKNIFIIK